MGALRGDRPVSGGAAGFLGQEVVASSRTPLQEGLRVSDGSGFEGEPSGMAVQCGGQHPIRVLLPRHDGNIEHRDESCERGPIAGRVVFSISMS